MLSQKNVIASAKAVSSFISKQEKDDILGTSLKDAVTEVWELDSVEINQVVTELVKMGYSDPIRTKAT